VFSPAHFYAPAVQTPWGVHQFGERSGRNPFSPGISPEIMKTVLSPFWKPQIHSFLLWIPRKLSKLSICAQFPQIYILACGRRYLSETSCNRRSRRHYDHGGELSTGAGECAPHCRTVRIASTDDLEEANLIRNEIAGFLKESAVTCCDMRSPA
jgi:hypothetical protein